MPMNLTDFGDLLDTVLDPVLWVVTARFDNEQSGLIATFVQKASLVGGVSTHAYGYRETPLHLESH